MCPSVVPHRSCESQRTKAVCAIAAVDRLPSTEWVDYLPQMEDAWSDLAFVLRLAGGREEAADAPLRLREARGDVVRAARVREELTELD